MDTSREQKRGDGELLGRCRNGHSTADEEENFEEVEYLQPVANDLDLSSACS
jgi:hypothetical protein